MATYEGYLTEKNLGKFLEDIFGCPVTPQKRFVSSDRTYVCDYYIESLKIAVEYNGPTHYSKTSTQLRDIQFRKYCKKNKIKLVEIPYFMQIREDTFELFFGEVVGRPTIKTDFYLGFISEGCFLPSDFNCQGLKMFNEFIDYTISYTDSYMIAREIRISLEDKIDELGIEEVLGLNPPFELTRFMECELT